MLPGDFLPPRYDGPFVTHEWLGASGGSPSVRFEDGIPVAWNPLSGADREVDEIWRQPTPPPPGTHYSWLGEPHASVSVRLDGDGNETARNLYQHTDQRWGVGSAGTIEYVHDGIIASGAGTNLTMPPVSYARTEDANGRLFSASYRVKNLGPVTHETRIRVYDGFTYHTTGEWLTLEPGETGLLKIEGVVPQGNYSQARIHSAFPDSGAQDNILHISEPIWQWSETVDPYFDGDTPSDRANDLWYNTQGVPHEWVNGEGWVAVTDDGFTPVPDAFMHLPISLGFDGDTPDITPRVIGHPTDIRTLDTYAVVNGVSRQVESVSLDAELTGDLPDQVVSAGGISGRTGTIVWSTDEDVQVREVSPWHKPVGWPPSAGDRVQVYVTDGVTSYPRFTGVIDKTTGSVGGRMQSRIIDFRDRLNGTFTHAALLRHHVPYSEGDDYRSIGLGFWYPLVMALRSVRVFNTPPMVAEIAVSAPLQRSVWAEAGTVTDATGLTSGNHANFYRAPWGYSSGGFNVRYRPRTNYPPAQPLQVTLMVADDHNGNATVDVNYGDNYTVRLSVLSSRTVIAHRAGEEICRLTTTQMDGATIVTLLVKNGSWTLRNDRGREATGSRGPGSSVAMSTVQFNAAEGARVAGMQVSRPNTTAHEFNSLGFNPSMSFEAGGLGASMDMMPRIENRNVADLVDEICKATLTAAWWDESGVLRFVQSDRLRGAEPVQTVTTLDDITELQWEDSLLSVRSRVDVDWKDPSISKSRYRRKELFRGRGDSMEAQDIFEVFATPDNDTEWFGVDRAPRRLNDSNWGVYNRKRGSFMGAYFMNDEDTELSTAGRPFTITTEPLGTVALKLVHTAGALGTGVEANLGTSENATALRPALRGDNLPVIRGFGEGKWVDETYTSPTTGPSNMPELNHNLSYWGQEFFEGGSVAQRIGDYIASMVTTPAPTIRNLRVLYDPRRQLGDVITIDAGILDVTLRALIVGISESHQTGQHTQSLTVRIIRADSTRRVTYDELADAWDGGDYNALQAVWNGLTYTDFENAPVEGAPNA